MIKTAPTKLTVTVVQLSKPNFFLTSTGSFNIFLILNHDTITIPLLLLSVNSTINLKKKNNLLVVNNHLRLLGTVHAHCFYRPTIKIIIQLSSHVRAVSTV